MTIHALQFLNELVTLSVKALGSSALLGVVLAAAKYAVNGGPLGTGPSPDARLQAAYFLQYLAETNLLTAQLLLTCQACCSPENATLRPFTFASLNERSQTGSMISNFLLLCNFDNENANIRLAFHELSD